MVGYIREAQQPQHHELSPVHVTEQDIQELQSFYFDEMTALYGRPVRIYAPCESVYPRVNNLGSRHALVRSALCFDLAKVCPGCLEASRLCGSPLGDDFLFSMGSWLWWLGTF